MLRVVVVVSILFGKGDVTITAMKNGDVKLKGTNIVIDATENVELSLVEKLR